MCYTINEKREEDCMYMNQHPLHKLQCRMREDLIIISDPIKQTRHNLLELLYVKVLIDDMAYFTNKVTNKLLEMP